MLIKADGNKDPNYDCKISSCGFYTIKLQFLFTPLKDEFKKQIEHMQKKSRRSKIHVERGFYTKEKMKTKLGWKPSGS